MIAVRTLHLLAMAFFVGGQLMLVAAVVPALRGDAQREAMRGVARRFGIGSLVALAVLLATGAVMATEHDRWGDGNLHAKLGLLGLIGLLTAAHVLTPLRRAVSVGIFAASLAVVALGVTLAH